MGLLDKFESVEVNVLERITAKDRAYCRCQLMVYHTAMESLERMAEAARRGHEEQADLLGDRSDEFLSVSNFSEDENRAYEAMTAWNKRFLDRIVGYFVQMWFLDLDKRVIEKKLLPAEPMDWSGFAGKPEYAKDYEDWKAWRSTYYRECGKIRLRFEQIVEAIFEQLDGFTLKENAWNNFLVQCWKASHYDMGREYDVKKDLLILRGKYYASAEDKWRREGLYATERFATILDAIGHYESGEMGKGKEYFPRLFTPGEVTETYPLAHPMKTIRGMKFYKNGRIDIQFRDAELVHEFVGKYLQTAVGEAAVKAAEEARIRKWEAEEEYFRQQLYARREDK